LKISIIYLFILLNFLIRCRFWKKKIEKRYQNSILKRIWKKNSYVVCFFAEFFVSKNVYFDCEFCDSILILFLLFVSEFVASSIFSSILENLVNENQLFVSFFSWERKNLKLKKKLFLFVILLFASLSIRRLKTYSLLFFLLLSQLSNRLLFWVREKARSFKKKIEFLDEKMVIKNDVSNLCKTNNSSFSSLNEFCVETIEIEEEKKSENFLFVFSSLRSILLWIVFTSTKSKVCETSLRLLKKFENIRKLLWKKREKKECRLKSSVNMSEWWFWDNQKEEKEHFFEDVNSMY
jgi:hypothetical protein